MYVCIYDGEVMVMIGLNFFFFLWRLAWILITGPQ